jgi:ribonuclease H2 subunit A
LDKVFLIGASVSALLTRGGFFSNRSGLGVKLSKIFVDTVGPPHVYQVKLQKLFPGIEIAVRPKADSLFPVVSAASICAKVVRDHTLRHWQFVEETTTSSGLSCSFTRDFGSGYTSDARTCGWLKRHLDPVFGFPSLIRFSWKTSQRLIFKGGVAVVWGINEEDEDPDKVGHPAKRQRTMGDDSSKQPAIDDFWNRDEPELSSLDTDSSGQHRRRQRFFSQRQIDAMRPDAKDAI